MPVLPAAAEERAAAAADGTLSRRLLHPAGWRVLTAHLELEKEERMAPLATTRWQRLFTQDELALQAGVPLEVICRIEEEGIPPRPEEMHRIARALAVPPASIDEFHQALAALLR